MNTKTVISTLVILAVLIVGYILIAPASDKQMTQENSGQQITEPSADTLEGFQQDIEAIDLGNLDQEFSDIDVDLNSL